jgi:pimeloyl-ACP methyl ester carboxylesterase
MRKDATQKKFIETTHGTIAYLEAGEGRESILYLHGWNTSPRMFHHLVKRFVDQGYRVICPWLPCSGRSFALAEGFSYEDLVAVFCEFIQQLRISHIHLVGHSLGGSLVLGLATRLPRKVKSVIVADAPLRPIKKGLLNHTKLGLRGAFDFCNGDITKSIEWWPDRGDNFHFRYELRIIRLLETIDIDYKAFNALVIPTLFLWGKSDTPIPLEDNLTIINQIHGAKLSVFPGRHLWISQTPAKFVDAVEDFIVRRKRKNMI